MTTARNYKNSYGVKSRILDAGVKLWPNATSHAIGREIGMSHSAVLYHFGNSTALAVAVARHAVECGISAIIVQLIGLNHPAIDGMTDADKARHLNAC